MNNKHQINISFGTAGYCMANARHSMQGQPNQKIRFYAMYALIQHPLHGYILFDTGYSQRFYEYTKTWPNRIYDLMAPPTILKQDEIIFKLALLGIEPDHIKSIIISHFHADHIAGLKDFPNATIFCSKKAFQHTMKLSSVFSFSKGVLKDLLPSDIDKRIQYIDQFQECYNPILGKGNYFLNDQDMMIFSLPGHAYGQIGLQVKTTTLDYFLIADAAWHIEAITENKLPHPIVRLFFDNWDDYKKTLKKLQSYHLSRPDVLMVPTHCTKTLMKINAINNEEI